MDNIVYCTCRECPWSDCERHLRRLKERNEKIRVSVANMGGVCRRYIDWLVERTNREYKKGQD